MNDRAIYLRHPDTRRVLALSPSGATGDFIEQLRRCGYLPATAADYAEQLARQTQRREPKGATP